MKEVIENKYIDVQT